MEVKKIPVYIVTGFMDAGKTTFIQDLIFRDYFHKREHGKTLIAVFEDGEIEYDMEKLSKFRVCVEEWEGGDIASFLFNAVCRQQPDRIFVEANCMTECLMSTLNGLFEESKRADTSVMFKHVSTTMVIDAQTLELYYLNMLQLLQDMVSISDPVIINRAENKEDLQSYSTAFRLMNPKAGFLWESPMGYSEKVFGNALPFDRMQTHLCLSESDYPHWYLDALEYPEHYEGKTIEADVQWVGETETAGRRVMTCCMNDIQFLGFRLRTEQESPDDQAFIHLTAKAESWFDPVYKKKRLLLKALDIKPIPYPSQLVLSVRR